MARFKLIVEYDGTRFVGWQRQDNGRSVQGAIEAAVKAASGEIVSIRGAGRTDSGVHARGQVAHVDLVKPWSAFKLANALNAHLRLAGDAVSILDAEAVPDSFDARFSAIRRHYLYRILSRRGQPALEANRVWWVAKSLDVAAMQAAADRLVGRHDFTTFRSAHCQAASPVRTLDVLTVSAAGEEIHIRASAQSFLHNQIRSLAGTLKLVGEGRWTPDDVQRALEAADRKACGPVAPPDGLYFMQVDYPEAGTAPASEDTDLD
ncbi:tRNA pseudouridine38-40 synthase [Rhizobium sp. RU20A]|uniref:tRNA pseudouridine(38-40) synthase TruA n=1 Tax=Rhizobium sp. RU20A TaxID=1907412 RepID=UPI0009551FA1|nr:tRNA pseudouridine(38-40) synthase TruA [Rhizobium sp. RU20A]SIQ69211.1 tRNA pseudouridine38-40 synthase [Rhizobium sp. RU20A]